jgi:hypothetical protein
LKRQEREHPLRAERQAPRSVVDDPFEATQKRKAPRAGPAEL